MQCGGFAGRNQSRQTNEDFSRIEPASAASADTVDDDDDDDEYDDGDDEPFDIPEETDDLNDISGLPVTSSPERTKQQTDELELESMSSVERKQRLDEGRHDGSVDEKSTTSSRVGSGRRKVSMSSVLS